MTSSHIDPARPDGEARNVDSAEAPDRDTDGATPVPGVFDEAYTSGAAPWVIGEPQPAIVALERDGWIRGKVLDPGCGTGEHTIHLTRLGYDVLGIDASEPAVEQARENAVRQDVTARFEVGDAMRLGEHVYETIVDSALFHIFEPADRARYVSSLYRACRPGGRVHVLALSDTGPGFGPQVSEAAIRGAFSAGWALEELHPSQYRGVILRDEHAEALGRPIGDRVDLPAWLARVRRI